MANTDSAISDTDLDPEEFTLLLEWIDDIPLTRVKRNLNRDFADAGYCADSVFSQSSRVNYLFYSVSVLVAEVIHHQLNEAKVTQLVEKHNYQSANANGNKKGNWELLRRLDYYFSAVIRFLGLEKVYFSTHYRFSETARAILTKLSV